MKKIIIILTIALLTSIFYNIKYSTGEYINLNNIKNVYTDENENLNIVIKEKHFTTKYHTYIIEYKGDGYYEIFN